MDDDGLNMRNWSYSEPPFRGHLGLQLMPTMADRSPRTFFSGRENGVMVSADVAYDQRNSGPLDTQVFSIDCLRNSWENQREKFLNILPVNHSYALLPEPYQTHHFKMPQPSDAPRDDRMFQVEGASIKQEIETVNEGVEICIPKNPKPKKPRKNRGAPKGNGTGSGHCMKVAKKNIDIVINGINMDISVIPIPVCSCTGAPHQCYRWGCGGWQSACCTTGISIHPLPMSTKRRGARIAGRKMSQGAFKKVLEKLAAEGYNFSKPIDMKTYWAKHGTNKFVTIR